MHYAEHAATMQRAAEDAGLRAAADPHSSTAERRIGVNRWCGARFRFERPSSAWLGLCWARLRVVRILH
jgi:hypothetical protein